MGADFDIFDMARKLKIDAEKQMRYQKTQTNVVFKEVNLMMNDYIVAKQAGRFKDSFNFDKKNNKKKND
jgi:hypothetical protein